MNEKDYNSAEGIRRSDLWRILLWQIDPLSI